MCYFATTNSNRFVRFRVDDDGLVCLKCFFQLQVSRVARGTHTLVMRAARQRGGVAADARLPPTCLSGDLNSVLKALMKGESLFSAPM